MGCKCASFNGEGRYNCSVSGDECMYLIPDSKKCAEDYYEGPDAKNYKCEDCRSFYLNEKRKRCCNMQGHGYLDKDFNWVISPLIEDNILCCGAWKDNK